MNKYKPWTEHSKKLEAHFANPIYRHLDSPEIEKLDRFSV